MYVCFSYNTKQGFKRRAWSIQGHSFVFASENICKLALTLFLNLLYLLQRAKRDKTCKMQGSTYRTNHSQSWKQKVNKSKTKQQNKSKILDLQKVWKMTSNYIFKILMGCYQGEGEKFWLVFYILDGGSSQNKLTD